MEATPSDVHPQQLMDDFEPLTKGQYPVFNKYPKFIVDYQVILCNYLPGGVKQTKCFFLSSKPQIKALFNIKLKTMSHYGDIL